MMERIKKYFKETPKEVIIKQWESLNHWDNVGHTCDEIMKVKECNHLRVEENLSGGRFDRCLDCGKTWGL